MAALVVEDAAVALGQVAPLVVPGVLGQREPVGEHQAGTPPSSLHSRVPSAGPLGRRPRIPPNASQPRSLPPPVPPHQRPLQRHPGADPEQPPPATPPRVRGRCAACDSRRRPLRRGLRSPLPGGLGTRPDRCRLSRAVGFFRDCLLVRPARPRTAPPARPSPCRPLAERLLYRAGQRRAAGAVVDAGRGGGRR